MLHVTNGDSAASLLVRAGMPGNVLPWRESWIDGPLQLRWWEAGSLAARSRWFEHAFGVPQDLFRRQAEEQLVQLTEVVRRGEEIVLWFEYDLYDQAILAALLHWLAEEPSRGATVPHLQLSWVIVGKEAVPGVTDFRGIGGLTPEQTAELWQLRREVSAEELAAGARAWEAYVSTETDECACALQAWLTAEGAALPVMAEAMDFHLLRSGAHSEGGLGIVEATTLAKLSDIGPVTPEILFGAVSSELAMLGMGDLSYWQVLKGMALNDGMPLLTVQGDAPLPDFAAVHPIDWQQWTISITAHGRSVWTARQAESAP
ncbi:DUF1835 domain-containing protein [Paenibacillus sp. R14(2021)]|uniref:DUF1835 domain-containing protein n=1 Tax=Paenibacillus sp. R14(2021) TaxID=2859228 RepID=UPI001C61510F|nr:DUF1835 domain-containing protein [Paenibacillus sp. R14(2021)]